jgi:hypothetical protein
MSENLSISGSVARLSGALCAAYQVQGALDCVDWRGPSPVAGRCDALWRQTCFELFFGVQGDSAYWEVNLGPNGCWNMYRFTDYRVGMREEVVVDQPVVDVVEDGDLFSLRCIIDCKAILVDSVDLELAVSCVIQDTRGSISYWAIHHHGPAPDFHNRKSFSMVLPGINECTVATMKRSER